MAADFVHLHLHTHYSLLDGACTPAGLLEMAKLYDMPAVAMTDHGFMGGALDMYKTFKDSGIKPIIGCEAYVAPESRLDKTQTHPDFRGYHLVLLAQDITGYHSLCKLLSEAHLTGFYYKPRIDLDLLRQHHAGLIGMSACIGGQISKSILNGSMKEAEKHVGQYCDIFGKENFYLELMDHGMDEERKANRCLIELSKKFDLPLVATNDVHYLKQEHAKAHEIMLCIETQQKLDDPKHFRFSAPEYYFKSPAEMKELFKEIPEAVTNTVAVAERCNIQFNLKANHYPVYKITDSDLPEKEYLRQICLKNVNRCYDFDPAAPNLTPQQQAVLDRMDFELNVISNSKYCSYFLVVSDFIKYAKDNDIPVGPGRGSGAGSVVAFLTGITGLDPLRYNLLFERFLNPERVSPPDFDIDFCEKRRGEVIEYVRNKYGSDSVAQIGTYGTLKAKAVIKDVARVLGYDFEQGNQITKLIPADPKMTLKKAREESKELSEMIENEASVKEIFEYAEVLEGINRQMGIHAAGVIIGDQRLDNLVPLSTGASDEVITEFPAGNCEELGLLKMDFLGLKTLTIIHDACENIKKTRGITLNIDKIPLDDANTFKLLNRGDTIAVFQLESSGMQNLCRQFGVETLEHVIALIAIYRPGPMQFIPDFIARKKGIEKIEYDHPKMEEYLRETYGIMLYQEQIMQVVQVLGGFTLGGSDILRRAIGKKKIKELEEQKAKFVKGCAETNNISEPLADQIWEKISKFAGYGFNKSHSAAYALVAYQTAYLKANYPVEFMTAVLCSEIDSAEQITFFINECREMGIPILPPDINSSYKRFTVDGGSIRFGLGAIKNVGETAAGKIIESRETDGKYKSFMDFCERAGSAVNSRMVEHLTRAGAFDSLGLRRSQLLAIAEPSMSYAQSMVKDRDSGQGSLFDLLDSAGQEEIFSIPIPDIPEFDENDILKSEKELLGFYVTGHPLAKYADLIKTFSTVKIRDLAEMPDNVGIRTGGIVKSFQRRLAKNSGKPFAIMELEDLEGSIECMVYAKCLEETEGSGFIISEDVPLFVEAFTSQREESERLKLIAEKLIPIDKAAELYSEQIHFHIYEGSNSADDLKMLFEICKDYPGDAQVVLCVSCVSGEIVFIEASGNLKVRVNTKMLERVKECLGEKRFKIKPNKKVPEARQRYYNKNGKGNG